MNSNYGKIILDNLKGFFEEYRRLDSRPVPGEKKGDGFFFRAFGRDCTITQEGVFFEGKKETGPKGVIVSLYALHLKNEDTRETPFVAYKDFPGSMPYAGAYKTHTELALVPYVEKVFQERERIQNALSGRAAESELNGDFSFIVYPLPKIALGYIFYHADPDFPASVTCLFSANANLFLPLDGLADLGEYTSGTIMEMAGE